MRDFCGRPNRLGRIRVVDAGSDDAVDNDGGSVRSEDGFCCKGGSRPRDVIRVRCVGECAVKDDP